MTQAIYVQGVASPSWLQEDKFADEGYAQNAIVYACISKIATSAASIDYSLMQYNGADKVEVERNPLLDILDRPNPSCGWPKFIEQIVTNLQIHGNAYVLRLPLGAKQPTEIWSLRADRIKIHYDTRGKITSYEYRVGSGSVKYPVDADGKSDVLHIAKVNPLNDWLGLSPMQPAAKQVDIVNEASSWNKSLLENGARPSGGFVVQKDSNMTGELTNEQYTRLREQLREDTQGGANAGKPMLLEGGLDWKEMGLSPKDMDYERNLWAAARMIATVYGVPPQLINIPGESTYSNMTEAKIAFWQDTVLPLVKGVLAELNNWLVPAFGQGLWLEINEDSVPALEERRLMKFERLEKATFMTVEEKRQAAGLDKYKRGGDEVILTDSGKVPLEILSDGGLDAEQA